jgi:hypothetical protein
LSAWVNAESGNEASVGGFLMLKLQDTFQILNEHFAECIVIVRKCCGYSGNGIATHSSDSIEQWHVRKQVCERTPGASSCDLRTWIVRHPKQDW